MADQPTGTAESTTEGAEGRSITLRIDESEMTSAYANTFRADHSLDEITLDFGMNRAVPGRDEMVFKVRQQVVINWRSAKRLALTLSNMIRQYEERFGELEINPRGKAAGTSSGGGGKPAGGA